MKYTKKILKSFLITIASILILTFIITLLNYFNIINNKILTISKIIIPLFSLIIGGYIMGINGTKNGWLEGLKIGLITTITIIIINLILKENLNLKDLTFYTLLTLCSTFGGMLGINKKTDK